MEVADKFEAMTADRSYKKLIHAKDAVDILNTLASEGKMDASLVGACAETLMAFVRIKPREHFPDKPNSLFTVG
jgi:HD-GYP domain-containing protein (c-di-GMP phosphodiesterase class II)